MGNQTVKTSSSFDIDDTRGDLSIIISRRASSANFAPMCLKPNDSSINLSFHGLQVSSHQSKLRDASLQVQTPTTNKPSHRRRKSSLLIVNNGITGKFISSRICKIAAKFWQNNIETLSVDDQLEIGCSIYFGMMSTNHEMRKLMKSNVTSKNTIERTSLRYLDMMGWLIRHLITDNIDLYSLLYKLGIFHQKMGIKICHYTPMLKAMHDTFAYYFEEKYNIEIKYAMDEIFSLCAQFMTGESLKCSSHLMDINKQFQGNEIPFLTNLDVCVKSSIGKEYLYRYLSQTWCDEIVIFLKALSRFKRVMTDKERFFVARDITKHSIDPIATFSLNISYENRINSLHAMDDLEENFASKENLEVPTTLFNAIEKEIFTLVMNNHWIKFCEDIQILQSKSWEL